LDVLVQLAETPSGRLRMCDLAKAVLLTPSGLSRRVDRLERAGGGQARARERGRTQRRSTADQGGQAAVSPPAFEDRFDAGELETLNELLGRLAIQVQPDSQDA
jgi:DNA-binding MarR family transcriptional regulator